MMDYDQERYAAYREAKRQATRWKTPAEREEVLRGLQSPIPFVKSAAQIQEHRLERRENRGND